MSEIGRRATLIAALREEIATVEATLRAQDAALRHAWAEHGAMHGAVLDMTARLRLIDLEFDALIDVEQQLRQTFDEISQLDQRYP
jgi:hypothetical protein